MRKPRLHEIILNWSQMRFYIIVVTFLKPEKMIQATENWTSYKTKWTKNGSSPMSTVKINL